MIRSMTGFGAASRAAEAGLLSVELRAVNSRHLKLHFRLPIGAERWEETVRGVLAERLSRGHVDVRVRVETSEGTGDSAANAVAYRVDEARADAFVSALLRLRERYDLPGEVDLGLLGRCERLIVESAPDLARSVTDEELKETVEMAAAELLEMRRREGEQLATDLGARLAAIGDRLHAIEDLAPRRLTSERDRLRRAVRELAEGVDIDDDRLAREVAVLADRWDIGEEIFRARAHLSAFEELLSLPEEEPVGKRLGFLGQELLREVNTIGAKANDASISRHVVEAKNELESLREQIENVE